MPRRLVYYVAVTIDGFIARTDGSFDCFLMGGEHFQDLIQEFPETFPAHARSYFGVSEGSKRFDTVLMGKATYEVGLKEGINSPYNPLRQYVVSSSLEANVLGPDVEVCRNNPIELVNRLKSEEGSNKDIWLCGGGKLAGALMDEIDDLILKINPVLIGAGIPLFEGAALTARKAKLIEHRTYENGFVRAHYTLE
jgi:dihydrofolate reductase